MAQRIASADDAVSFEEANELLEPLDNLFPQGTDRYKIICNKVYWRHNFRDVDFSGATFRNVSFIECNLKRVNFGGCRFINTNFYKSVVEGAIIMDCIFDDSSIVGLESSADYKGAFLEGNTKIGKDGMVEFDDEKLEKRLKSAKPKELSRLFNEEIWKEQVEIRSNILYLLDDKIYIESLYKFCKDLNVGISPITSLYLLLSSRYCIAIVNPSMLSEEQWKNYFKYLPEDKYNINTIILTKPLAEIKIPKIYRDNFIIYDDWKNILTHIRIKTKFLEEGYLKAQKRYLLMERLFTLKMMFINNKGLSVKEAARELGVSKRTIERDINKLYQIMDFTFSYDKKEKKYKHSDDISEENRVEIYDFPELYKKERPKISMDKKDKEKKIGRYTWIINYLLKKKKLFAKRYLDEKGPGIGLRTLQRDLKELMLLYPCVKYDSVNKYYYADKRLVPYEWKMELVASSGEK